MASVSRGYSVFDAVRARIRSRATGVDQTQTSAQVYGQDPGATGLRSGTPGAVGVGQYDSPFMESPETVFTRDLESGRVNVEEIGETSMSAPFSGEKLTGAEAAAQANIGTYGPYDPTSTFGRAANTFAAAIDPTPFGLAGLFSGTTTVDPYGRTAAKPTGIFGRAARMNIENQYEVAEKIKAGTPGFHQFYSGGQLVSISPQTVLGKKVGYGVTGTFSGSSTDAINQYAAAMGYDPSTVNLESRPGRPDFGIELDAFVPGSGGFTQDGKFIDVGGNRRSPSVGQLEAHIGLTADIYGLDRAVQSLNKADVNPDVKGQMMDALQRGELTAQPVVVDGETVGYETGSGGVVKSKDGNPVTTGSGGLATSGAGVLSQSMYESLKAEADFMRETGAGGAFETGSPVEGFTERSGRDDRDDGGRDDGRYGRDDAEEAGRDYDPSESFFAEGGEVPPDQVPAGDAPVGAQAGFVGQEPEGLPDGMTVADDVPLEVPEGTFVINAPAVEFAGSDDIKKMILEAMDEAEKQGIDIKQENVKIPKEELVSLVVSKGEVIVPPQLAQVIGYDRLNKINNRGKQEVEERIQENAQKQESPAPQKPPVLAKSGGFISKPT